MSASQAAGATPRTRADQQNNEWYTSSMNIPATPGVIPGQGDWLDHLRYESRYHRAYVSNLYICKPPPAASS